VASTTSVTTAPPTEPEVEWTTLVVEGREFRVPKALEIDPSFLAALPEDMRQEILNDQVRNFEREESQRRAQRAAAYAAANPQATDANPQETSRTAASGNSTVSAATAGATTSEAVFGDIPSEISPEFISALPQEIRDELLAEHRRTAAAIAVMTGSSLPDSGPAEFLRTLQPHLRQQVLADMDESQIGALPEDMANEARALRAAMETQQQQYFRDRMSRNQHEMMNMLTDTTHHSVRPIRMYNSRAFQENRANRQTTNWYSLRVGANAVDLANSTGNSGMRGRQLLDYESICCLLVLLFIDDNRMNFARLQKVLKNLCHHTPTRQWIVRALLSIIHKSTGRAEYEGPTSTPGAPTLVLKSSTTTSSQGSNSDASQMKVITPAWLTVNFESAFGARTNVFKIQRLGQSKRHGSIQISVHAQACPIVCRQVLESLIILAKQFSEQFLPLPINQTSEPTAAPVSTDTINKITSPDKQVITTPSKATTNPRDLSFWELLLKLDQSFHNRTNRSSSNPLQNLPSLSTPHSTNSQRSTSAQNEVDFDSSPLAALLMMLDHPILNKNNQLMDKLFKLLSSISESFQRYIISKKEVTPSPLASSTPMVTESATGQTTTTTNPMQNATTSAPPPVPPPLPNKLYVSDDQVVLGAQLDLVIKALISKSCTEDGLEFATNLLLNISKINQATRDKVLHLLLNGTRLLGKDVSDEIKQLHWEVQDYLNKNKSNAMSANNPSTTEDDTSNAALDDSSKLFDSFRQIRSNTFSSMATDANAKQQDLQLPAMVMLTSKAANQQFLLRILKVIIQLREATKKEQTDAQTHLEKELEGLTRRLETVRQTLRSYFPAESSTNESNNEALQPVDQLYARLDQMRTRLQTVLESNTVEQRQWLFSRQETINDVQDIHRLIHQVESLLENFHEPTANSSMTTRITDVLQTIPSTLPSLNNEPMDVGAATPFQENKLTELLSINSLWDSLSECLMALAKLPDPHAVLVLQPAVEAFFLVHAADLDRDEDKQPKKKKERETREVLSHLECFGPAPTTTAAERGAPDEPMIAPTMNQDGASPTFMLRPGASNNLSTTELPIDAQKFVEFARTHRTVLNQILRQSTQHLSEGPFHILTDYTSILDFDVKRKYFRHELDRLKENIRGEDLAVHVRRIQVFEDSFRELSRRSPEDWKHRFYIVFDGEEGQDAGGLLREWYSIIARSMFDPNYALFMINPGDRVTYMPNPLSHYNANHIQYFKFIGRVIAKAIFDNKYMDCYFTRSFYKHILGVPIRYTDMESVDLQFYRNLVMALENDIHQLGLDLTFALDDSEFGVNKVIELLPNGSTITVTNENKHEYVRLVCQEKMIGSIRQQINAFLEGFYSIIPKNLISIFNEQELELLISGRCRTSDDHLTSHVIHSIRSTGY
jgi:E3 ubiquitin-protein ligase HUWE1